MKLLIIYALTVVILASLNSADAGAAQIVAAARSQINVAYVFGGGDYRGKPKGGFDCSGLAQFAVYRGTHKVIQRIADQQYNDKHCRHVPYASRVAGDLVFYGNKRDGIYHVGIITGPNTLVHAPQPGDHVREATIWAADRISYVQRCF